MAVLCACGNTFCQNNAIDLRNIKAPLFVDEWVRQDMPLGKFINHKSGSASLADFKDKVVVFAFWFTTCTPCIAQFPKEDSLQRQFDKDIQLIMVTYESEQQVRSFIQSWELKNKKSFNLPIIVEDTLLRKSFHRLYSPHYVWILPGGKIAGQTGHYLLSAGSIEVLLPEAIKMKSHMKTWEAEKENKTTL